MGDEGAGPFEERFLDVQPGVVVVVVAAVGEELVAGVELACQAVKPPSTWIEAPVMYAPSVLARWATVAAISAASA